ncbi:MAG TPA: thiamine-phosphate kinase [Terriglobales bacterium]|nr:thiamine-phosphate kinase [Terriglobales bacterium]
MPLAEKALIRRIRRQAKAPRGRGVVRTGIGDDAAVLKCPAGFEVLLTTDFSLEGVHFRREWHPPDSVGHRCLTRGLSDIAAMGGEPTAAFLSLALPPDLPQSWVDRFMRGLLRLAREFRVRLAGGDTAESPAGVLADIVVVGRVPARKALLRSGARPGDSIYVTGELGRSAWTLHRLREAGLSALGPKGRRCYTADAPHFYPQPRVAVGCWLREQDLATAAIDVSDGLSTDLGHICEESGVGALVHEAAIPRPTGLPTSSLRYALHGGEDYELLFTAPGSLPVPSKIAGVRVTRIGEIIRGRNMWLVDSYGQQKALPPRGWEHFAAG